MVGTVKIIAYAVPDGGGAAWRAACGGGGGGAMRAPLPVVGK